LSKEQKKKKKKEYEEKEKSSPIVTENFVLNKTTKLLSRLILCQINE